MRRALLAALGAAALSLPLVVVAAVAPAAADHHVPSIAVEPIAVEPLTPRSTFPDDVSMKIKIKQPRQGTQVVHVEDLSRVVVARITVQPGARFPLHTHPGPVVVNVVSGELTFVDPHGCVERVYPAGTAFVDSGEHVHSAYGSSAGVTTLMATFFGAPAEGPLTIPAGPPPCG
jgi:predicted metal-dependent enzyme (double-stranded beta helix superfamily)